MDNALATLVNINMDVKYSIIIPHYNNPELLMRCLKSIPVSEDIQVIVVDDNSPNADTAQRQTPIWKDIQSCLVLT